MKRLFAWSPVLLLLGCGQSVPAPTNGTGNTQAITREAPGLNAAAVVAPDFGRKNILLTATEIGALDRTNGTFDSLLRNCAANMGYVPSPVSDLRVDPIYTPDGQTSTPDKRLANDSNMAYRFAVCYLVSADKSYATKSEEILNAWAKTLTKVSTEQGKYEVNFNFPRMVVAANWIKPANQWDSRAFDQLLIRVVRPQSTSSATNNHGFWGVLLEASIAAHLNDATRLTSARLRFEQLLKSSVAADGSLPQEITRSATSNWNGGPDKGIKGMAYTHFTLLPASVSAKIFADRGQAMWTTEGGKKLELAFRKAAAWTLNPETFPYYASNNGQLIGVDNASYFPLLLKYYASPEAEQVLATKNVQANSFLLLELF